MILVMVSAGVLYYVLGQIWFCQIVIYPLFARVGSAEYVAYHHFYGSRIPLPVIVPGFASFLLPVALWWMPPPAAPPRIAALNAACGLVGLVLTVAVLIPRHARLERHGKDEAVIQELVRYNWARTLSITASTALTTVMLLRAAAAPGLLAGVISEAPIQTLACHRAEVAGADASTRVDSRVSASRKRRPSDSVRLAVGWSHR